MHIPAQKMLMAIAEAPDGLSRAEVFGLETHARTRNAIVCLDSLSTRGLIQSVAKDNKLRRWMATRKGRALALEYRYSSGTPAPETTTTMVLTRATPRQVIGDGTYMPTEIFTRPGSDAAFRLPSRIGSRLVHPALP